MKEVEGKPYSKTYIWTQNRELNAIFNHAEKYDDLKPNPVKQVTKIGKEKGGKTNAWTLDQYKQFSEEALESQYYEAYEILYWCGLRAGEMLALTVGDIDLEKNEIHVNKSLKRIGCEDLITEPKTENSNRIVKMPGFLANELNMYMMRHRKIHDDDRLFTFTHVAIGRAIHRFASRAMVPQIRLHDLRHSFVSLLINNGFTAYEIGQCVGHSGSYITYRYAHLFDETRTRIARKLEALGNAYDDAKKSKK